MWRVTVLSAAVGLAAAVCDPCDCDANGIVGLVNTGRPGCAKHVAGVDESFCYVKAECQYPLATMSEAFPTLKWYNCDTTTPAGTTFVSDDCDPVLICPQDGGWPETKPSTTVKLACPAGQVGGGSDPKGLSRTCSATGTWGTIVNECITQPTCTDGIQNGDETGVDCGGSTGCPPCSKCTGVNCGMKGTCREADGKCICVDGFTGVNCQLPPVDPCNSLDCGMYGTCSSPMGVAMCTCILGRTGTRCEIDPKSTCSDGIQNGEETGVDCGNPPQTPPGETCPPCSAVRWRFGAWSECTVSCGSGVLTRTAECVQDDAAGTVIVVPDAQCEMFIHPAVRTQACVQEKCPSYQWTVTAFGMCSKACGGGTQVRSVKCQSSLGDVTVADSNCDPLLKPAMEQDCNTDACVQHTWETLPWGDCSKPCGGGLQSRVVQCLQPDGMIAADATACSDPMPATERSCNVGVVCTTHEWDICPWDDCTAICNGATGMLGTMFRSVICRDGLGNPVDDSLCTKTKPDTFVSGCNTAACTDYNWMASGPWGDCIGGKQARQFHCHSADGGNYPNKDCEKNPLPPASRSCVPNTCPLASLPTDNDNGVNAAPGRAAPPLTMLLVMFLGAMGFARDSFSRRLAVLVAFAVLVCGAHAGDLEEHHLMHVTEVQLTEAEPNKGVSIHGHTTPYAHNLRLSFNTPERSFELGLSLMHDLLAPELEKTELVTYHCYGWTKGVHRDSKQEDTKGSVTIHSLENNQFYAVLRTENDVFNLIAESRVPFDVGSPEGMLMYSERDLADTPHDHMKLVAKFGLRKEEKEARGRHLLVENSQIYKANCHSSNANTYWTMKLGMMADAGYSVREPDTMMSFQEIVGVSSAIYNEQFRFSLQIAESIVRTNPGGEAWNLRPDANGQCQVSGASADLNLVKAWAAQGAQSNKVGLYHLLTDCFAPPGVVGVAYVGVLCAGGGFNTGLSTWQRGGRTWLTYAHEIGHNFGGGHSFEEGQGTTGGIMDYGDGKLNSVYQFNSKYRETEMCQAMKSAVDSNKPTCIGPGNAGNPPPPTTVAPAPTPPTMAPTDRVKNCGKVDQHKACPMWAAIGSCENTISQLWMEANCGPSCCSLAHVVPDPLPYVAPAVCGEFCSVCSTSSPSDCDTCQADFQPPFRGDCFRTVTPNAVGASEYLGLELQVDNLASGNVVLFSGTLDNGDSTVDFEVSVDDYKARVKFGDVDATNPFATVAEGSDIYINIVGGFLTFKVDSHAQPLLPFSDTDDAASLQGFDLTNPSSLNDAVTYTITGLGME